MTRIPNALLLGVLLISMVLPGYSRDDETASATPTQPATAQPAAPAPNQLDKQTPDIGRKTHIRLGAVSVGASYAHFSGPFYGYPWSPYGYSPFFWSPFWSYYAPFYYPPYFAPGNGRGAVRLSADPKSARVFIDNAYAGTGAELKSFWLDPGAYDLEVTAEGRAPYRQRIYVLSGRTLRVTAALELEKVEVAP